jgi:hypothetical protein
VVVRKGRRLVLFSLMEVSCFSHGSYDMFLSWVCLGLYEPGPIWSVLLVASGLRMWGLVVMLLVDAVPFLCGSFCCWMCCGVGVGCYAGVD